MSQRIATACFLATMIALAVTLGDSCFADRIFEGSIADIPQAEDGVAEYYYDADTGQVIMSIGRGITFLGLDARNITTGFSLDLSQLTQPTDYPTPGQSDESGIVWSRNAVTPLPSGVFNIGSLLHTDSNVVDGRSFDEVFGPLTGNFAFPGYGEEAPFFVIPPEFPTAIAEPCIHAPPPVRPSPPVLDPPTLNETPLPVPDFIDVAANESLDLYYNRANGEVIASLGEGLLIIGLQDVDRTKGALRVENANEGSLLGVPEQANNGGLGYVDFSGLPSGVFNLGMLLEANDQIGNTEEFEMVFGNLIGRSGASGKPEKRTRFEVINHLPEDPTASINSLLSLNQIELPDPENAQAYYDPDTGNVVLAIGESLFEVTLAGASSLLQENISAESNLGDPLTGPSNELTWLEFTGLTSGVFNIGRLLPQGIVDQEEFNSRFGELSFSFSTLGGQEQTLPIQILRSSTASIPEPGSSAVFGLVGACTLTLRRRRQPIA